jgi:hypothetical protein
MGFAILPRLNFQANPSMASKDDHYTHGAMDISQHQRSYAGFLSFVKYSLVFILLVMAFLAFFRTHG